MKENKVPYSEQAENSVIGGMLIDNSVIDKVIFSLAEEDFYLARNKDLFREVVSLYSKGVNPDLTTMYCSSNEEFSYITQIMYETPSVANIDAYIKIVKEKSSLRKLLNVARIITAGIGDGGEVSEIIEMAEKEIFFASNNRESSKKDAEIISIPMSRAIEKIDKISQGGRAITGVPTGYIELDRITCGLQAADLAIIAARPSMGKTAFAMNIAQNAAIKNDIPTLFFSLEMPADAICMRLISSMGSINQGELRRGNVKQEEWSMISAISSTLSDAKIFIDDSSGLTPTEIRSKARRMVKKEGVGLIIIDYLQLMHVKGMQNNRVNEVSEISRSIKGLAKELSIPIIALSQLNRTLEHRVNKRPIMSDLRDSGSIEQDADLIMFIYRDEVYNKSTPHRGIAEIIIGKHRNGATGDFRLRFDGKYTRFEEMA